MKTLAHGSDRDELLERLRRIHAETPRRWGKMSAHQMICHAADAYRMAAGRRAVEPVRGPMRNGLAKWVALYAPLPWPRGIQTCPEVDPARAGTKPVDFTRDVAEVEAFLALIASAPTSELGQRSHPIFGRMTGEDWQRWGYLHMDHHLRQFGL